MSPAPRQTIRATEYVNSSDTIIASANRLGREVVRVLSAGSAVEISLRGLKGVPSSFFNVVFGQAIQIVGGDQLEARVRIVDASNPQTVVYRRSLDAVRRRHA